MKRGTKRVAVEEGSGNVFADLGLPHAEQELLKARLTLQIYKLIKARGLTRAKAGEILGINQPHISALLGSQRVTGKDGGYEQAAVPSFGAQTGCWPVPTEQSRSVLRVRGGLRASR
jgi:predicted XRE-type DNA-binding protein